MVPRLRDNEDVLLERLERLARALESKEFGRSATFETTINPDDVPYQGELDEPNPSNTARYFSTGPARLKVTGTDEFDRLDFGVFAATVNIRTTDDIVIAFASPQNEGNQITIRSDESPFTIGGDTGIDSAFMWVKQADSAGSTPLIEVIAFR